MKIILIAVLIILFIGTIKCIPVNFSKKVFERKQKERMKELESQRECECMGYSYECWICLLAYSNGCVHKNRDGIQRTYGYLDFIHFTNSDVHLWRFALPGGNQKNVSWNRCTV